jgi:light-regulated signal transduction histidine kinase (bacteriophytochrome)
LDDNGKDYLNRVRANSQRMAQLIDDMLQLSRLTRGELHLTEVNLSLLAEEIIQENRELEPHRKVNVMIQENLTTNGDKRLLQAVLQNLLNNAWKFTSQKEESTIEFKIVLQDDRPVYMVRDDGAGFEMEFVDKLFGAFQRLHAMHEFPGTGIGLATVQRIIHRHGGKVWAEGEPNRGARFYFTINPQNID